MCWFRLALRLPVRRSRSVLPDLVHGPAAGAGGLGESDLRTLPGQALVSRLALRTRQVHGIWGGLTEEERHQAAKTSQGT